MDETLTDLQRNFSSTTVTFFQFNAWTINTVSRYLQLLTFYTFLPSLSAYLYPSSIGKWYHIASVQRVLIHSTAQILSSHKDWCMFFSEVQLQQRRVGAKLKPCFCHNLCEEYVFTVACKSSLLIHVGLKHHFHMVFIQVAFPWLCLPDGCPWDFSFYNSASIFYNLASVFFFFYLHF